MSLTSNKVINSNSLLFICKKAIQEIIPDAQIILYGSRARGDARIDSDYDLIVLVKEPVNWQLERIINDRLYVIELETDTLLSTQIIPLAMWNSPVFRAQPFVQNVMREGIRI